VILLFFKVVMSSPTDWIRGKIGEPVVSQLPPLELDGENVGIQLAASHLSETRQHAEHRPVVGQYVGGEPATGLGGGQQGVEQESAQAATLPAAGAVSNERATGVSAGRWSRRGAGNSRDLLEFPGTTGLAASLVVGRTLRLLSALLIVALAPGPGRPSGLLRTRRRGRHSPQAGTREDFEAGACLLLGQPTLTKVSLELAISGGPEQRVGNALGHDRRRLQAGGRHDALRAVKERRQGGALVRGRLPHFPRPFLMGPLQAVYRFDKAAKTRGVAVGKLVDCPERGGGLTQFFDLARFRLTPASASCLATRSRDRVNSDRGAP
jgi:hypothetical protein